MDKYYMSTSQLPFRVNFSQQNGTTSQNQTVCNTNMCLLPNGPVIPSRPIFPSALPSDFRPSATTIDTNYLNVKKIGCICNLRCKTLTVDDGSTGTTTVLFRDLPINNGEGLSYVLIDGDGKLFKADSAIAKKPVLFNNSKSNMYQPDMVNIHDTNMY